MPPVIATHPNACVHCGTPTDGKPYCCTGCERVHGLIVGMGLDRFYRLGSDIIPVGESGALADGLWLESLEGEVAAAGGPTRVTMDVSGVRCASCVWLVQSVFSRAPHAVSCVVNPSRGRLDLIVEPGFDLRAFAETVGSLGYGLGPNVKRADTDHDGLTVRMGVVLTLAMFSMMLSLSIYFGLAEGAFYTLARTLLFAFSAVSVVVGGSVFFRAAYHGLRARALHLDLPIAVGIGLSFVGSVYGFLRGASGAEFFDTVTVFIGLMLLGRWAQERVVLRSRAQLLGAEGAGSLMTRRARADGRTELVRAAAIQQGDLLSVAPGELVVVDAVTSRPLAVRLDWINGEAEPRQIEAGGVVPAGAFSVSAHEARLEAKGGFDGSPLIDLLSEPTARAASRGTFWDLVSRVYVTLVLVLAAGAFALWMSLDSLESAMRVTTAVLVVTCPCAIGLALPLAHRMAYAWLRRRGLFVRSQDLFTRMERVRRVMFDKTGTLTTGTCAAEATPALGTLAARPRTILAAMVDRSSHPKARAVAALLDGVVLDAETSLPSVVVNETPGEGLETWLDGHRYRLGHAAFAETGSSDREALVFTEDGRRLARFDTREPLRVDAAYEIAALRAEGLSVGILSGDADRKVQRIAETLGVASEDAVGGCSAEDKRRWLAAHGGGRDTLFVGDGINDTLAASAALASGTPAVDRPFMAERSDFYFVTGGLAPIRALLAASRHLHRVSTAVLAFAVAYNVGAVALAYAGLVLPWVAAILMPVSSVVTVAFTAAAFTDRRVRWTR